MSKISVILPKVTNEEKLNCFCNSLFSNENDIELLICNYNTAINKDNYKFNNIFFLDESDNMQLNNALALAKGEYIIISQENAVYSSDAISVLIKNADTNACACNVSDNKGNLFIDNFTLDELSTRTIYCNHLLRKSVIDENNIAFLSQSDFGIMCFLADYYRFDKINAVSETLIYIDYTISTFDKKDADIIKPYCDAFSFCEDVNVLLFFVRNAFTFFSKDNFVVLQVILYYLKDNDYLNLWIKAKYNTEISTIIENENFNLEENNTYYKEVKMPLLASDIVKEFKMGKQGSATLKKCIVAYIDYNIYIQKGNKFSQYCFKLLRKILGGGADE